MARTEQKHDGGGYSIVRTGFIPAGKSLTQRILNQAAVAAASIFAIFRRSGSLKTEKPDLIIGTVPALPIAVVAFLASKRFRVPYIIDLRDAWPDLIQESDRWNSSLGSRSVREKILSKGPLQLLSFLTTKAMNLSLERARGIIVTSSRLGDELKSRHSGIIQAGKQTVGLVRNVFPPEVDMSKEPARTGGGGGSLRVLYAGTLGRAQNLANAIEAAELVSQAGLEVELRLVGAGAAKSELARTSESATVKVEISSKIAPEDLEEHYGWADTALVHLTDWNALSKAVPSKTYELMSIGMHISAVVKGETAELIESLEAGHVVPPEQPERLAALWMEIIENPQLLQVSSRGVDWVLQQREQDAPKEVLRIIEDAERKN